MEFMHNFNSKQVSDRQSVLDLKTYDLVAVIGVGGIGNWVAFNLALTNSVRSMLIVDPDDIETSNLNRTIFRICDIGKKKVDAIHQLILERRIDLDIIKHADKFKIEHLTDILTNMGYIHSNVCVVDCRDEIFDDIHEIPSDIKIWKVGYDGLEITIDGNPRETKVWGNSRGYSATPSFICSSQFVANIVCNHIVMPNCYDTNLICIGGPDNKFNKTLTYNTGNLIPDMYKLTTTGNLYKEEASVCQE